uniref:CHK domain-containing protein n=1 Tax=Enterobius vermicularis TaxID=51028 RepID=A0A0N4VKT1_ENTVE
LLDNFLKSLPDRGNPNVDTLCENILQHREQIINDDFLETLNDTFGTPPVLAHGDLWSANILWHNVEGERKIRFIVDWQLVHRGCIAEDILRYIFCATSVTDRRQHFDHLFQYYYEELEKSFGARLSFTCDQVCSTFTSPFLQ